MLHIATAADWRQAQGDGVYRCLSLIDEGFVHCCSSRQLAGVVERYYRSVDHLVLLTIDATALDVDIRHENTVGGEETFPHVYGAIPVAVVTDVRAFGLGSSMRALLTSTHR